MPTISMFFGIVIRMYYDDHAPPHFHAYYAERAAVIEIEPPKLRDGSLPPRALSLVLEWTALHRDELLQDWELAVQHRPLIKIEPLE